MSLPDREFGKIRSFLWPLHRHEFKKIVPMMLDDVLYLFQL